jgi:glycosyltransferase involved in cell wall biosynthesis
MVAPPWFEVPPAGYGGIESMCHWLVEGLRARGHHVVLAAAGPNRTSGPFVQTYPVPPTARLGQALPEVVHAAQASRALDELDLDIVHDHSTAGPLTAGWRRAPTVATVHSPVAGELAEFYRASTDRLWLVAISAAQRRSVPDLPWVGMVHNGIRADAYPYQPSKGPFALFLGRMSPEKGAHLAIDAARASGLPLVLAGKRIEPVEHEYFDAEIRPRLSPEVAYVGEVGGSAKKTLLSRARCLLFPIQWGEPFGLVMIEAMACGTPVVALAGGSVGEIVLDGVTGFICNQPDQLPDAIAASATLSPRACRDHVAESFDVEGMVDGYERAYRDVIRRSEGTADGRRWTDVPMSGLRPTGSSPSL